MLLIRRQYPTRSAYCPMGHCTHLKPVANVGYSFPNSKTLWVQEPRGRCRYPASPSQPTFKTSASHPWILGLLGLET